MTKKNSFILAGILISSIIGVGLYFVLSNPKDDSNSNIETTENTSQRSENNNNQPSAEPEKPTSNESGEQASMSASLSIARITQLSDGTVSIRANVNGTSSGECIFSFAGPNGESFERKSAVKLQQTSYTCSNVDVERSAFGVGGNWSLTAYVQDSDKIKQNFVVE